MAVPAVKQHIDHSANVRSGKPHIAGTRIAVQDIAIWHVRLGMSVDEISDQYDLSLAQIYSALAYYFDNREQIDQAILTSEAFAKQMRENSSSVLAKKLNNLRGE